MWREYLYKPSYDPDSFVSSEDLHKTYASFQEDEDQPEEPVEVDSSSRKTFQLFTEWANTGSQAKSEAEVQRLVQDVFRHPDFKFDYFLSENYDLATENKKADAEAQLPSVASPLPDSFKPATINIEIPSGVKNRPPYVYAVPGLYYRKLTTAISACFKSPVASQFHYTPFHRFRTSPVTGDKERIYTDIFDSDAFIHEHDMIQRRGELPPDDLQCKREKTVAALMFWSDSTHLANFGTAKLWPIYLYMGNLSKYVRGKPNSGACQHLAYMPSLPDSIEDEMKDKHPSWKTQKKGILTHCRRELIHGVWYFLLDDDFLHAHRYGMVIMCEDGVERRVYPRIFTYSADYPEKCVFLFSG